VRPGGDRAASAPRGGRRGATAHAIARKRHAAASTLRGAAHDAARNVSLPRKPYHARPDDGRMRSMRIAASFEIEYLQYLAPDGTLAADLPPQAPAADEVLELF